MDKVSSAFPAFSASLNDRVIARFEIETLNLSSLDPRCQACRVDAKHCDVIAVFDYCFHFMCFDCYKDTATSFGPVCCPSCKDGFKVVFWLPGDHRSFQKFYVRNAVKRERPDDSDDARQQTPKYRISFGRIQHMDPDEVLETGPPPPILNRRLLALESAIKIKIPAMIRDVSDQVKAVAERQDKLELEYASQFLRLNKLEATFRNLSNRHK